MCVHGQFIVNYGDAKVTHLVNRVDRLSQTINPVDKVRDLGIPISIPINGNNTADDQCAAV